MNKANYKDALMTTFKELSEKFPDKWQPTTSRTCFSLSLSNDALYICNYIDSRNLRNISIYTIDADGNMMNNTIVNEQEETELYDALMNFYEKIKQQVKSNKIEKIISILHS